jgi:cysteinyl-tRNA synthetase
MSEYHLGEHFDIHGGGADLQFPHHENEIAQSEGAHNHTFVNYWMHNGFIRVDNEKMSKSLGNFFTVNDLLASAPGEAIRLTLLSAHYHQPIDWTAEGLKQSRAAMDRFYLALRAVEDVPAEPARELPIEVQAALEDDLNTPLAISHLHDLAGRLNKAATLDEKKALKAALLAAGDVLGILQQPVEAWFRWTPAAGAALSDAEIEDLVARRLQARKDRDFAEADRIRKELTDKGVLLEDGPRGTQWRRG